MRTYWAMRHECVSCQYWNGPREVKSDPRVVEADPGEEGICMGPNSTRRGKPVQPGLHIGGERCYCMWYCLKER